MRRRCQDRVDYNTTAISQIASRIEVEKRSKGKI